MTASLDQIRASIISLLPRLRRCARTITRTHDDADDLVQVAVEHALEQHQDRRPDSRFESWMFGLLRAAWDAVRARQPVIVEGECSSNVSPEAQAMHGALAALPEEQRIVIALVLLEGLSYEEASEVLDVPLDRVTSWLARGREALHAHL